MNVTILETLAEFKAHLGLTRDGAILETDLDVEQSDCDRHGRRRRDAEVLCTLAANAEGACLDLGTSHGRSAFKLATNLAGRGTVFTVNLLPEQHDASSGKLVTHLLPREAIGSFYRERRIQNIVQFYANTAGWNIPAEVRDLAVVFVDAAHDTERVYQDTRLIYDRVRPGGFICWHDFTPAGRAQYDWVDAAMRGVERFVAETCPEAELVHLRHSWMGVLRKPLTQSSRTKLRVGLVLEQAFHQQGRWTSVTTPHLVNGILNRFDCCWIQNQTDYEEHLGAVEVLLSFEAGWGAPVLALTRTPALRAKLHSLASYMFYSDPHGKPWREDYLLQHGIDFLLAFYDRPTRTHFRRWPVERLVHFPWAIPDPWLGHEPLVCRGDDRLTIFGASEHEAYAVRNWCRQFPFVESCLNSGCENKIMTDEAYVTWLAQKDAVIAAGSEDPRYRLTTPKYFETVAVGSLLFAQETDDLDALGFRHLDNCVVFNRVNFEARAREYLRAPKDFLEIRRRGRELIRQRHALSVRLDQLQRHMETHRKSSRSRTRKPIAPAAKDGAPIASPPPVVNEKRRTGYPSLSPAPLGPEFTPRVVGRAGAESHVALGELRLRLRPDRYLDRELIEGRLFERDSVALLARLLRPGQTVVDVGANFGYFTLLCARWVGPSGRVIAFEPTQEYGRRLRAHVRDNHLPHVRCEPTGLSDTAREAEILIGECSGTLHWTAPSTPRAAETIRLGRFDDWWARAVAGGQPDALDFMKLDVDGHELQVLRGARATLQRHRPVLLLEFFQPNFQKAGYTCAELADYLEQELGYVLHRETDGQPFADRSALLTEADRPDRSINVLGLPALPLESAVPPSTAGAAALFTSPAELYLASADRMDRVLGNLRGLRDQVLPAVDTYATVIGGLSGLNYLLGVSPRRIVFFDLNALAVSYARFLVEMIRMANRPEDFISRVFGRRLADFLAETGEVALTVSNQARYLARPVDAALVAETRARLSPEARRIQEEWVTPHLAGRVLDGVRNCRRLLPCWPENERVPVGGGLAFGCDEAGRLVPNTNTFFYGLGWLASPAAYWQVREALITAELQFLEFDLLHGDLAALGVHSGRCVLHASNIDDWFPQEWAQLVPQWQARALQAQGQLVILSSHNGLTTLSLDPHAYAHAGLAPFVHGRVVEVTHKVPWGFHEFARTNVTVRQYLAAPYLADTTILHILLGEGIAPADFLAVYRRARRQSRRILVLEHNRDSADWAPGAPSHFVTERELRKLLLDGQPDQAAVRCKTQFLAGERDAQRNLLIILDTVLPEMNATPSTPLNRTLTSGRKPRVLLMADVPNWIFARHCQMLDRLLGDRYAFTIRMQGEPFCEDDYDLIYPLEWNLIPRQQIRTPAKYVTGIRSHLSWKDEEFLPFADFLNTHFQRVHVVSERLRRMFAPFVPNLVRVTHGVDTSVFTPRTRADQSGRGRLRLGWAGNRINATKGFEQYIAPLGRLPGVELQFCGYQDQILGLEQMREFYDSMDAYVCASSLHHEGNNNSLMEAAAMERALITTNNGTVPEYLREGESALIVERELPEFIQAVIALRDHPERRVALGKQARLAVERAFAWRDMAEQYALFFEHALAARDAWQPQPHAVRQYLQAPACAVPAIPDPRPQPTDGSALKHRASQQVLRREWAVATPLCRQVLEHSPADIEAMLMLAKCFFHTGGRETARLLLEQAVELDPQHEIARENLAALDKATPVPTPSAVPSSAPAPTPAPAPTQAVCTVAPTLEPKAAAKFDQIACPFCGRQEAQTYRRSADIVRCVHCDTVYLRTRFKTEILEQIYQTYADEGSHMRLPKSLDEASKSGLKRDYFLNEILQHTKPEGRLLDVGCGWGAFLLNARDRGFDPQGLELTRKAVRYANEQLRLPVVATQFLDTPYDPASIQVVTMLHVLEHLPQPKAAIAKVFEVLQPGGMFCGIVPNMDSFCAQTLGEQWYWLDPNYHYVHYTPATLRRHLEAAGFVVERIYTACGDYGTAAVRQAAEAAQQTFPDAAAFETWLKDTETRGQGEELRFFARKPVSVNVPASSLPPADPPPSIAEVPMTDGDRQIHEPALAAAQAWTALNWTEARAHYQRMLPAAKAQAPLVKVLTEAVARLDGVIARAQTEATSTVPVAGAVQPSLPAVSFCIITNGQRPEKLRRTIASIRALHIPEYEILVGGQVPDGLEGVTVVPVPDAARCGRLGEMRNRLTERARYDHLVVADDDLVFLPDFYAGLLRFGDDYEVQCVRFLNPDGTRYWDWATNDGPRGHALLSYDETDPHVYVTGGLCIMKASVARRVQWDEGRGFYQGEDADFSQRLHAAGIGVRFNPHSTVVHHDPRCTAVDGIVLSADGLRQTATEAFRTDQHERASELFYRLLLFQPATVTTLAQFQFDCYVARREGRNIYLRDDLLGTVPDAELDTDRTLAIARRVSAVLAGIGPFYTHFGGAGDALLLLATFLDACPDATVVTYPNSPGMARSFFDAFPSLRRVIYLPSKGTGARHLLLRMLMRRLPGCRGVGTTPEVGYDEWTAAMDVFNKYGVTRAPQWTTAFRTTRNPRQVAVAPQGSLLGMVGSKRNMIDPQSWPALIACLREHGAQPVLLGTPDECGTYPCLPGCEDRRSFSFREQMEHIAASAVFVGADSWGKTFAALAEIPTFVFEPLRGADWIGKKDASDFVFLDPWEAITVVKNLEHFREVFPPRFAPATAAAAPNSVPPTAATVRVAWDGSFLDLGSLSHVNRELTRALQDQPGVALTRLGNRAALNGGSRFPELVELSHKLQMRASLDTQVTVRHAWPPNWQAPRSGALVVIQPWEYGALPEDWVRHARDVTEFWVPSDHVRRVYVNSGVPAAKVHVVPNGINPERFHPAVSPRTLPTQKSFKFLFVGGTIHRKGPDLLLQSYLDTFTAADDVCLVIKDFGGKSVYAGQTLRPRIQAAQAQPNAPEILYLDDELAPDEIAGLYTACDCLVHPYRGEGFGLPVLEAMACGLPVIVTGGGATDDFATDAFAYRVPARREFFGTSVSQMKLVSPGWMLEPSVPALSDRLRWVATHRDEARTQGRVASEQVRREWTWDRAAAVAAQRLRLLVERSGAMASTAKRAGTPPARPAAIELPPAAKVGHLAPARQLLGHKQYLEAWQATLAALRRRPYHPEAFLLLAEIAQAVGDVGRARHLAGRAHAMAPKWKPARQFLKSISRSRGQTSVTLPDDPMRSANAHAEPRLTVCLIARNEEQFIGQCLESVRAVADQIVVMDTGSTDWTKTIAARFGAEVHTCEWQDDFSAARNAVLEHATGNWVLMLDADEELTPEGRAALPKALLAESVMAYRLPMEDVGHEPEGRNYVPRLFRNAPGLFYVGRVHEQVYSSLEVRRLQWGLDNRLGDVLLRHHGYTSELVKSRDKIQRNLRLLARAIEELPDEPNLLMNYGLELVRAGERDRGVTKYYEAFESLSAKPPAEVVPELRETLLTQLATQLLGARNYEAVVKVLTSPLARRAELTASMHFLVGLALMELKQPAEAVPHFRQCVAQRHRPALSSAHKDIHTGAPQHCLAMCLTALRQSEAADAAFRAALQDSPVSRPIRFDYAASLIRRGHTVEALKLLHQLVSEKADDVDVWHLGTQAALSQPEFLEFARDWTGEALKAMPNHPALLAQRAAVLLLSQQPAAALPLWNQIQNEAASAAAGLRLCQALEGQSLSPVAPEQEVTVSRELVDWYRGLLRFQAAPLVERINARLPSLAAVLPSAVRTLETALREAHHMEAA